MKKVILIFIMLFICAYQIKAQNVVKKVDFSVLKRGGLDGGNGYIYYGVKNFSDCDIKVYYLRSDVTGYGTSIKSDEEITINSMKSGVIYMVMTGCDFLAYDISSFRFTLYVYITNLKDGLSYQKVIDVSKEPLMRDVVCKDITYKMDPITGIENTEKDLEEEDIYGIDGKRRKEVGKGLNIIRTKEGTYKKIIK